MTFRMDQAQRLYSRPDLAAFTGTEIALGEEVEIGSVTKRNGVNFCPVRRSNGQSGYIPGDTRGSLIKTMTIDQPEAVVYSAPYAQSWVRMRLAQNARIRLYPGVVDSGAGKFVQIRDGQGNPGFIDATTRVKTVPEVTRKVALHNVMQGAVSFVIGVVLTVAGIAVASHLGGFFFVFGGAVVYGAIQFFKGLGQLMTARI